MEQVADPTDRALLNDWQRDFPVSTRPFLTVAETLGTSEAEVIRRLQAKINHGQITRVGATVTPNTISASTLAAISAPHSRIEEVAEVIGAQPGVNHSYLRDHDWNLWFVVTGPDRAHVDTVMSRISHKTGLRVLDLKLVRPFKLDLGFSLRREGQHQHRASRAPDISVLQNGDRNIVAELTRGLPVTMAPYQDIANRLGRTEAEVMSRIKTLADAGIISRLGVIVRHRALGWRSNAMVVWDLPHDAITTAGPVLAAQPGVTLCYERAPVPGVWPYRLYSMIHARTRAEALDRLSAAAALPKFRDVPHRALFSSRCFKQTGAMIGPDRSPA